MSGAVSRFRPRTASTTLIVMMLALPVISALAGLSAWEFVAMSRRGIEERLAQQAKSTAMALDARLMSFQAAGMALAATDEMQPSEGDNVDLYAEASRIAALLGVRIVVQDAGPSGQVILNTLLAPGQTVPRSEGPSAYQAVRIAAAVAVATGQPEITDIFVSALTRQPTVAVVVPVVTGTKVTRLIYLVFDSASLSSWLSQQDPAADGFLGVRDGNGRVLATTTQNTRYAGMLVPPSSRSPPGDHGVIQGESLAGPQVLIAYQRPRVVPTWVVVATRPVSAVASLSNGPARFMLLSALGIIVLGVLSLVAVWLRRNSELAAFGEMNRLLSDVPAILYVNRVYPDGSFRRRFLSRSAERVTGWPADDLDADGALAEKIDPAFVTARSAFFREALEHGRARFEYQMWFADGTQHWMRVIGVCLRRDPDGAGDVLGFITDITEERGMRDELRRSERFALLGEVAGRISHEMNQPMAAISMAAENGLLALERQPLNLDTVRDKFHRIERQVERVVAIIGHISAFSRKEATVTPSPLDIDAVLRAALSLVEARLATAAVTIDLTLPPHLPRPLGVPVLVEQIVVNLLLNACDAYAEKPEMRDRVIRVEASHEADSFLLRVSDHAGGIPVVMIETIFDPFVTTKPPGKGTGLGLSFCMATATRMGGRISATNRDGGAVFELRLPIEPIVEIGKAAE